jgi:hypothetical protein
MRLGEAELLAENYTEFLVQEIIRKQSRKIFDGLVKNLAAKHGFVVQSPRLEMLPANLQAFLNSESGKSIRALFEAAENPAEPSRMIRVGAASARELAAPLLRSILDRNFKLIVVVDDGGEAQDLKIEARAYAQNPLQLTLNEDRFQVVVRDARTIVPAGLMVRGEATAIVADGEEGDAIAKAFDHLNVSAGSLRLIDNSNLTIAEEMVLTAALLDQRTYALSQQVQFTSQHREGSLASLLAQARALDALLKSA